MRMFRQTLMIRKQLVRFMVSASPQTYLLDCEVETFLSILGTAGQAALDETATEKKDKVSTRQWVSDMSYDARKLFHKLFNEDIKYLLSMKNLWEKRRAPTPLDWKDLPDEVPSKSTDSPSRTGLKDQQIWSMKECFEVFADSVSKLKTMLQVRYYTCS